MEEEKKKTTFLFIFSTYLPVFLFKFQLGELIGCIIKFRIQWVPTRHTFDGPRYPKNNKYLKKRDGRYVENTNKKSSFFMIPIPKFILKNCLRPIRYFKFKSISLANTWWHGIWIRVERPIFSWNFLYWMFLKTIIVGWDKIPWSRLWLRH